MAEAKKPVVAWLITGIALVTLMVVIGGITRLTNSGLSIVEWKLIMGVIPPQSTAEWQSTFEKYQQFPEYQKINQHYTLADFKSIFWWEYLHRLLGRIIGVVFLVPFLWFWFKGYFTKKWLLRLGLLFFLGGFQGFLGWFMVKSGLVDQPDVSHYRLAIHLMAALLLLSYIVWLLLDYLYPDRGVITIKTYHKSMWFVYLLALLQITYGAFVAGLNAGKFYPTFPKMDGYWMPPIINTQYHETGIISLISDVSTVQFIHRSLGLFLALAIITLYYNFFPSLLKVSRRWMQALMLTITLQVILGITALLYSVPFTIAVLHQFTAVIIVIVLVANLHFSRPGRPATV